MSQNYYDIIEERNKPEEETLFPMGAVRAAFASNVPLQVRSFLFPEHFPEFQALCAQMTRPEGDLISLGEEEIRHLYPVLRYHDECCAALLTGTQEEVMRNIRFLDLTQVTDIVICILSGLDLSLDDIETIAERVQDSVAEDANVIFSCKKTDLKNVECLLLWTRERE